MLPSTLDMVPSPSTWNPRPSTLDKKIDSVKLKFILCRNTNLLVYVVISSRCYNYDVTCHAKYNHVVNVTS